MARSKRAGARREVIRRLRKIKESVSTMQLWWTARGTVYVLPEERTDPSKYLRSRPESEYPENRRHYWASTITEIDDLMTELAWLQQFCVEQYYATPPMGEEVTREED